ncbi:hypothetical protein [Okeania sp. SIO2C9]|uniref:hypothetical protein n=1 Tax=Okeania sp. SIO2C9 TaxID=2607791 RepID=UPI0025F9A296|nr:hypothetical protein [Okeania sp. SIO2C9]
MNFSNFSKQILTALATATVSLGATFSLLAPSGLAASFTTQFLNSEGGVEFELDWSGEFGDDETIIGSDGELTGEWIVRYDGQRYELGSGTEFAEFGGYTWVYSDTEGLVAGSQVGIWGMLGDEANRGGGRKWSLGLADGSNVDLGAPIFDTRTSRNDVNVTTGTEEVSTPEPSLTLGFIALSGLMLGGTRKSRKGKS